MLHGQPFEEDEIATPTMEDLPSLLQKKEDLTFPQEELLNINIGIIDKERLLQISITLTPYEQERYKSKFIEYSKIFT